jgi:hypothetical protein
MCSMVILQSILDYWAYRSIEGISSLTITINLLCNRMYYLHSFVVIDPPSRPKRMIGESVIFRSCKDLAIIYICKLSVETKKISTHMQYSNQDQL